MLNNIINKNDNYSPTILTYENNKLDINQFGLYDKIYQNQEVLEFMPNYLDVLKTNNLEIENIKFKFTDSIWDFRKKGLKGRSEDSYLHNFEILNNTSDYYITLIKFHVLYNLLKNGIHWTSIKRNCSSNMHFIKYIYEKNIHTLEDLNVTVINNYYNNMNIKYRTEVKYRGALLNLLNFYSLISNYTFENEIIDCLSVINTPLLNAECKAAKRNLLPQTFMKDFKDLLYELTLNTKLENETLKEIRMNGALFICTQTGLRPSEILNLTNECLKEKEVDGIKVCYLYYNSTKNNHGGGYTSATTIANNEVQTIVKYLINNSNSKYIMPNIKVHQLNFHLRKICLENKEKLNIITTLPDESFEGIPEKIEVGEKIKYVNIPIMTQFRVYFSSELSHRGYSEMLIGKLLNHKDEKMLNYYSRPATSIQEDINFSELIVKETLINDYKILGPNGDIYKSKMEDFIKNRNINIKEDLVSIIDEVCQNMPIRRKLGGYCIKSNPLRACEHDAETNEFYCAYGLCQNQCHFYYHCVYYYTLVLEGKKLVDFNVKNKYKQQSQKELYKLQAIINTKLLPEIEELKNEIKKKGKVNIVELHPELEYFIENLKEIEEDLNLWKMKKL